MRRFSMLGVVVTTAALAVIGCGSDSEGGSSSMQCVGNYADLKYDEFVALTADDGDCTSLSDTNTVCSNNMTQIVGNCGKSCLPEADQATCVAQCVQTAVTHGNSMPLSTACLTCYGADVECAKAHCLVICGSNPSSADCAQCREDNGCAADFYACSGLPAPTSP